MSLRFLTGAAAIALIASLAPVSPASAQQAAPAAPAASPMTMPAMGASITANPNPYSIDLGPLLGKTYVTGVLTGLGFVQNNTVPGGGNPPGRDSGADLSNGMAAIQKTDGLVQYFLQAGVYSLPVIGQSVYRCLAYDEQHVRSVAAGLSEDRADGQLLDSGGQVAHVDRARAAVHVREHQHPARAALEPGEPRQSRRPGQLRARAAVFLGIME